MSMFSWLWGGSKKAAQARQEKRGLKIYAPPAESRPNRPHRRNFPLRLHGEKPLWEAIPEPVR